MQFQLDVRAPAELAEAPGHVADTHTVSGPYVVHTARATAPQRIKR
jgi:hypothetical protein